MATKTKDEEDEVVKTDDTETADVAEGPEATAQKSAASLQEAMDLQDKLGREANGSPPAET